MESSTQTFAAGGVPAEIPGGRSAERPKRPKMPPKTAKDLASIAYLDKLRSGEGEKAPENLPLACIVKVVDYEEVPKANELYAMVRVEGPDGRTWRMCAYRDSVKVGRNYLFVSANAALPVEERWRNPDVCTVKEKVYKYGFGVKVRRLLPHVKRNIYRHNSGVLYPVSDFKELKGKRVGMVVAALLKLENAEEMKMRQNQPKGKEFRPEARKGLLALFRRLKGRA